MPYRHCRHLARVPVVPDPFPVFVQGAKNTHIFRLTVTTRHNHHIQTTQLGAVLSETFPYQPLYFVTAYRPADPLASDGQSQARVIPAIRPCQYREKCIRGTCRGIKYTPKFGAIT